MAWQFKQIEPQPARGVLVESMWNDPNWIAEEKYDGDRRIAQVCGKIVRFTGRRKGVSDGLFVEKTSNVPHLSGAWEGCKTATECNWRPPPASLDGTVLDGEMIAAIGSNADPFWKDAKELKGGLSKYVTSIMGSLPEEAVRKQIERGWLRYVIFDCLYYKGKDIRDLPLWQRRSHAKEALNVWGNPFVSLSEQTKKRREYLSEVLARGGEGVILKNLDHRYGDKKGWVKVKAEWTADVVIMGYKSAKEMSKKKGDEQETQTKYAKAGLIGAVVVGQYAAKPDKSQIFMNGKHGEARLLSEVATISGMDDGLRRCLTVEGKDYLGLVVEIAHNGREPTGRFRHPRFKRFRDDKQAKDCIYREGEI